MRRILLAGVVLAGLSGHAQAQIPVTDGLANAQLIKGYLQDLKTYLLEAQKYATQLQQYKTELDQYLAFVHDPSLGTATGLIARSGYGNDLPINPMMLQSLAGGYGNLTSLHGILGKIGSLNGLINSSYAANHVYSPTDGSWASEQMIANGNAIATTQGQAQAAYLNLRTHLPTLQALQDRLATATTPKDVADAHAAIANEAAWTNNLQTSLQAIDINYRAQADSRVQRENESINKGIDAFLAEAAAAGRGL